MPTSLVDARDNGCTGTEKDSTECVQATIDAAAKKGAGAAAYFPARSYIISKPINVPVGNYTVLPQKVKGGTLPVSASSVCLVICMRGF